LQIKSDSTEIRDGWRKSALLSNVILFKFRSLNVLQNSINQTDVVSSFILSRFAGSPFI